MDVFKEPIEEDYKWEKNTNYLKKFRLIDEDILTKQKKKKFFYYFSVTLFIIIFIIILIQNKKFFIFYLPKFQSYFQDLYSSNKFLGMSLIFIIMNLIIILMLPSHTIFSIFTTIVIGDFFPSFFILLLSSLTGSLIVYFIVNWKLRNYFFDKFKKNFLFQILSKESKFTPYKTAFLTRILFVPAGFKDYFLSVLDNPLKSFFISSFLLNSFFTAEAVSIGLGFTEIEKFFQDHKSWDEKSPLDKFFLIVIAFFVILTFFIVFVLGYKLTKRYNTIKNEEIEIENFKEKIENQL